MLVWRLVGVVLLNSRFGSWCRDVAVGEKKCTLIEPNKWRARARASSCFLLAVRSEYAMMTRPRHTNNEGLEARRGESAKHIMSRDVSVAREGLWAGKECRRRNGDIHACHVTKSSASLSVSGLTSLSPVAILSRDHAWHIRLQADQPDQTLTPLRNCSVFCTQRSRSLERP